MYEINYQWVIGVMGAIFRRATALLSAALLSATIGVAGTTVLGTSTGIAAAAPGPGAAAVPAFLNWRFIYRGTDKAQFDTVTVVNQRDAWVAGDYAKNNKAMVLHWNGKSWRSVAVPDAVGFMPWYSDESSGNDVWLVGYQNTAGASTPRAIRWTGSGWQNQPMPSGVQGFLSFRVLRPNSAWLASILSCPADSPPAQKCSSLLWHWNGTTWHQYELPVGISSLAGSSGRNVWLSAYKADGGKLNELRLRFYAYRWSGSAWRPVAMAHPLSVGCMPEIDTTSSHNVWMTTCGRRGGKQGLVLHWNGRSWQRIWNLSGEAPLIDGRRGVWIDPTTRWTRDGVGYAGLPIRNASMSFTWVTRVPGTTTLLAVGETWTNPARERTYMAIIGGRFGPYRPAPSGSQATERAAQQLVSSPRTGVLSRW
jgi:hypothetical protein